METKKTTQNFFTRKHLANRPFPHLVRQERITLRQISDTITLCSDHTTGRVSGNFGEGGLGLENMYIDRLWGPPSLLSNGCFGSFHLA